MKYCTTKEIAEKWNISDRRVRTLCRENRVDGVREEGGVYYVPSDAKKPADRRFSKAVPAYYLKWEDRVVGEISEDFELNFIDRELNPVVAQLAAGADTWSRLQLEDFLEERIVSRDRRDIERILFRCGLSRYDTVQVALATRAINAKDMLWIARTEDERFADVVSSAFSSIFLKKIDMTGDSVDTPEGFNIKRYGVYNGAYGIYKKRISPLLTDVESEVAVYGLAKLLGVPCCPAVRTDEDTVFSEFLYDFSREYLVHFRRLFDGARGENEYFNLLSVRPQYQADIIRMLALDFITRQDDRHLSNIAVKQSAAGESFYPLYDNGRSLFYEDSPQTVERALSNIPLYSTGFGPVGTYYDHVRQISASGVDFGRLLNLNVPHDDIRSVLVSAGLVSYRLDGALEWICKCMEILK